MTRTRITDIVTMKTEEQQRPSSGNWLTAVSVSQKKYVSWVIHPCAMWLIVLLWEFHVQKWPWRLTHHIASFQ